jgi:hypothetical protein
MTVEMFYCPQSLSANPLTPDYSNQKIYADVPLRFFNNIDDLKKYVLELKNIGVNVLLILPHFKPSLSPYVVKNYEQPCELFGDWKNFAEFMKFVENLGMDRMIDIPFNHADWQADNLKREWFKDYENDGIEAGADDVDADNNRVRINWGAFILDNSLAELQNYWLEKVIFPHIEKYHVNSIRIDAAWGLDPNGLKRIISATKKRYPHVWFLAENLGMAPLIELAESGIEAGADRFFNNMYWYSGGLYIPADIYKLYKRSNALPTCSIFSSHDTLMPAMKALAKIRSDEVKGLNDKAIVRKFVEYENIRLLQHLGSEKITEIFKIMELEFALTALMTTDLMFAAGSEKGLFERIDVLESNAENFAKGVDSDFPLFMKQIIEIKKSAQIFNAEGVLLPFGQWQPDKFGCKGFVKSGADGNHALVCVNNSKFDRVELQIPRRMQNADSYCFYSPQGSYVTDQIEPVIKLEPQKLVILTSERKQS